MSEPAYDLAGLSIEAELRDAEDGALLARLWRGRARCNAHCVAAYKMSLYLMAGSGRDGHRIGQPHTGT